MSDFKVFFPTNNIGKYSRYMQSFKKANISYERYLVLDGVDIKVNVVEDGKTVKENAHKKAKFYYDFYRKNMPADTNFAVITSDEALYIDGLNDKEQPGLFVRRFKGLDGKRASDEEVVEKYTGFVKTKGSKAKAKWSYAFAMYDGNTFSELEWVEPVVFNSIPHKPITEGYPLNNITVVGQLSDFAPEDLTSSAIEFFNSYKSDGIVMLSDLTDEARERYLSIYTSGLVNFVKDNTVINKKNKFI